MAEPRKHCNMRAGKTRQVGRQATTGMNASCIEKQRRLTGTRSAGQRFRRVLSRLADIAGGN